MNSKLLSRALTQARSSITSRLFYHDVANGDRTTLYSKISPLGDPHHSVSAELDNWIKSGQKVRFPELQRIIKDLRKHRRFSQALEVSEWMSKSGTVTFSPVEHAIQIDLIGKVNGFQSAESYFDQLREIDKTEKTYGALLNCYSRQRQAEKAIAHLNKMKELGFASSTITYNDVLCLYKNLGQHEKIPSVLAEMKANNVSLDNYSYRICISSHGSRSEIDEMEKVLLEMEQDPNIVMDWNTYAIVANFYIKAGLRQKAGLALEKAEEVLEFKDGVGFNHLISLNARLGNSNEVSRLWELQKSLCKKLVNKDYILVLESLMKLGQFPEAESILKEWEESSGNYLHFSIPNVVIVGYVNHGMMDEAEGLIRDAMRKGMEVTTISLATVAKGIVDNGGEMGRACELMKEAILRCDRRKLGWKPNPRVVTDILRWVGDEGRFEEAKGFVEALRNVVPVSREMYIALLKAGGRSGEGVVELVFRAMEADGIELDERTEKIVRKSGLEILV